jgi:catechol 2,3-dioxygenase-like lactoylglutathione lyase family enzyme
MEAVMQIKLASVMVDDQEKALAFYAGMLGFEKQADIPMGPRFRWLTVSSPDGLKGAELVLELTDFPASRTYQKARFDAGIPAVAFMTDDVDADYRRLKEQGVRFRGEPQNMGPIVMVAFEDTCGNLVNLVQASA